ncbi:hypothetical protein [Actinomadura litoris]|uniref:hypothetical protein n=1 Tax=Actinomadura litoris TaxID=2678616 RepID=UPI001C12C7D2|nr:hypothetical protein [Actinomadura litoris]
MVESAGAAKRSVLAAMCAGLGLTVVAAVVPYAGTHLLADHIRDGYPAYSRSRVDAAVTVYLTLLSVVGALGVIAWLWTAWAVQAGKRWARSAATAMLALGAGVGASGLLIKDTSGDTGLPPVLGWLGTAPCLAGLAAVVLLWRRPPAPHAGAGHFRR